MLTYVLITIIFSAVIGSFLSVCIYRIPLGRKKGLDSLDEPEEEVKKSKITICSPARSFCPSCNAQLRWYHNIPVISYLSLRGKCASCKAPIPMRYLIIELLSILFALLSLQLFGPTPTAILSYIFCATLIVLSFIDLDYFILPNVITYPCVVIGMLISLANGYLHWFTEPFNQDIGDAAIGVFIGGGSLWLVSSLYELIRQRQGLGFGDVKLLAVVGALLGWRGAFFTIFLGSFLGCILGIGQLLFQRKGLTQPIPFGPYLAGGTLLYMLHLADPVVKAVINQ